METAAFMKVSSTRIIVIATLLMLLLSSSVLLAARRLQGEPNADHCKRSGNSSQMLWDVLSQHFTSSVKL
jgi:hypothetical protein